MYITRSQRTGKIHSTFVFRFVLGQVDVVVQNIEVDEIFISTRKEVSLDLDVDFLCSISLYLNGRLALELLYIS